MIDTEKLLTEIRSNEEAWFCLDRTDQALINKVLDTDDVLTFHDLEAVTRLQDAALKGAI